MRTDAFEDIEIAMRVESDINSEGIFYTDLNAFQVETESNSFLVIFNNRWWNEDDFQRFHYKATFIQLPAWCIYRIRKVGLVLCQDSLLEEQV